MSIGDKYEAVSMDSGYKKYMMLKIRNVGLSDFGSYKCVAKNSLGETDGVIKLEEIPAPTTIRQTTVQPTTPKRRGRTRLSDRLEREGFDENRVVVGRAGIADNNDYDDYDEDGLGSTHRPPTIKEPPGAYSGSSNLEMYLTFPILLLLLLLEDMR
ncbi:hypothetical protein Trydic_g23681 [Trypoxylus dichotomus]